MNERPWTAILKSADDHITAVNVGAPLQRETAQSKIEKLYSGQTVVALIPGSHADGTHTFCPQGSKLYPKVGSEAKWIDLYDVSDVTWEMT